MAEKEKFNILLEKYALDNISAEERSEFFAYIISGNYDDALLQHIENNLLSPGINTTGAGIPPHRSANLLHKILSSEQQNALLIPKISAAIKITRWAVAAAVTGMIVLSFYFLNKAENKDQLSGPAFPKGMIEKINASSRPLKIEMEEGSMITLQPGSSIHYPVHFLPGKREIFLDGAAFFEVSKNASRPFFVYNKNIVTHVLGTSFNIKINPETKEVEVSVRSGKVEVYENKATAKIPAGRKNNGVILLPNQKVVYDQDTRQFVPSLVDIPLPIPDESINKNIPGENFLFDEAPLRSVLGALEKSYGIDIIVENENIYKCLFTGDVRRQDLYAKLDIICQAVQASYEVKGTKILIKGSGCK